MDWAMMSSYEKAMKEREYLQKARDYQNNFAKQKMKMFRNTGRWNTEERPMGPVSDTAAYMKFQDYFHPTGKDLSDTAMQEAGQGVDRAIGSANPIDMSSAGRMANKLGYIGNKRNMNFLSPEASGIFNKRTKEDERNKLLAQLQGKLRYQGGY